jgi:hypothetical protein
MSGEPDDLTTFTRSLANVPPHAGQLDRDALLFAAGRAAGRRGLVWPTLIGVLAVLSVALTATLLTRPTTVVVVERTVRVPAPVPQRPPPADTVRPADESSAPDQTPPSPALTDALRLRQRLLRDGLGELPRTTWTSESTSPSADMPDLSSLRLNAAHTNGETFR